MRAAVVEGGRMVVREVPDPTPGPDDLVLEVIAVGVCGSDIKTVGWMPDGTVMGHEMVGEVVAIGDQAAADGRGWATGDVVVSMPATGCGRCRDCAVADVARCADGEQLGVGGRDGAFAEFVRVSARESWHLGDAVAPELGAVVEPLAVGLHVVNRARLTAADTLLVIGAGPVGLTVVTWARRLGVAEIVVSDPQAARRAAAVDHGATRTVDPAGEDLGGPYDVVVEAVGAAGMVGAVVDRLRPRGRGVIAGVCLTEDPFMPVMGVTKDVDLLFASYYTTTEFAAAARLLGSGEIDYSSFVTARHGLDELPTLLDTLSGPHEERKVLITPRGR